MAESEILFTVKGVSAFMWKMRVANVFVKLAKFFLKPMELNVVKEDNTITKFDMEFVDGEYRLNVLKTCYVHTSDSNRDVKLKNGNYDCEKFKIKVGKRNPPFMYMYLLRVGLETVWFSEDSLKRNSDKYRISE